MIRKYKEEEIPTLVDIWEQAATIAHPFLSREFNEMVKTAMREMFAREFSQASMHCIIENIFEDKDWGILEWKDPLGLRGCGFFNIINGKIKFQRGYWDQISFLRQHDLPIPTE